MTTNRIDHTGCDHRATPADRKVCRTARRARLVEAQAAYRAVAEDPNFAGQRDYEAMVQTLSFKFGITLRAAYDLVENGPCVF